jgi:hypothetical protein
MKSRLRLLGHAGAVFFGWCIATHVEAQLLDSLSMKISPREELTYIGQTKGMNIGTSGIFNRDNPIGLKLASRYFNGASLMAAPPDPGFPRDEPMSPPNPDAPNDLPADDEGRTEFFPNPVVTDLSLTLPSNASVMIVDFAGCTRFEGTLIRGEATIDLTSLPSGRYILFVQTFGKSYRHQLVKN